VACKKCGSANQKRFEAEVDIHSAAVRDVHKSPISLFPSILVCLVCGHSEFVVPAQEMKSLGLQDTRTTAKIRKSRKRT
jgi:hypothetical protein